MSDSYATPEDSDMVLSNWITDIAPRPDTTKLGVEYHYFYALQDANYNVMGIVNTNDVSGTRLVERYEYTPYGQRTVYSHGYVQGDVNADGYVNNTDLDAVLGSWNAIVTTPNPADISGDGYIGLDDMMAVLGNWNAGIPTSNNYDPLVTRPLLNSARFTSNGEAGMGPALCEVGHQGLLHDEEFGSSGGLIHNRARTLHPQLGRFMQRDPLGYVDGMSLYPAYNVMSSSLDPFGTESHNFSHTETWSLKRWQSPYNGKSANMEWTLSLNWECDKDGSPFFTAPELYGNLKGQPDRIGIPLPKVMVDVGVGERVVLLNLTVHVFDCPNDPSINYLELEFDINWECYSTFTLVENYGWESSRPIVSHHYLLTISCCDCDCDSLVESNDAGDCGSISMKRKEPLPPLEPYDPPTISAGP